MDKDKTHDAGSLERRISGLEQRIHRLEGQVEALEHSVDAHEPQDVAGGPAAGKVSFRGAVDIAGRELAYEWVRPADYLSGPAWDVSLQRVAALASPIRAQVLRYLLEQPATVAELVDEGLFSSTGKAYHHLNELLAAGWLIKDGRGSHSVPPARVIPLLVIVAAGEDH